MTEIDVLLRAHKFILWEKITQNEITWRRQSENVNLFTPWFFKNANLQAIAPLKAGSIDVQGYQASAELARIERHGELPKR